MSGRKEISPDYKAQRSSRPDLLKLQWPHLRPLVEAFGYRNISVEGFEADDVIAALTEQAKERGIPVMVVTGDRDAYQLVERRRADHEHEPRRDRHEGLRPPGRDRPLRHPAGAGPGLHRPQGRHVRQHPRRPGHRRQDGLGPAAALRRPRDRARQRRRDLRRQAQAEPHRARRRRAAVQAARDDGPRRAGRHRPRGRDDARGRPLRRAARCSATGSCATRCAGSRRRSPSSRWRRSRGPRRPRRARSRRARARPPTSPSCPARSSCSSPPRPTSPRASCCRPRRAGASRRSRRRAAAAIVGSVEDPAELVAAAGRATGARARGQGARRGPGQPRLRHRDRGLPARPRPARLPARRAGRGARHRGRLRRPPGAARRPRRRARRPPARADRRARARTTC